MVSLELRELVEQPDFVLDEEVNRQVAEIMEAAEVEEEQASRGGQLNPAWNFTMPFAGVRYFSYD